MMYFAIYCGTVVVLVVILGVFVIAQDRNGGLPMKPLSIVLLLVTALALSACSATNIAELTKALANDPASVCVSVSSVYGVVKVARTNIGAGSVSCTQEGLTVKSDSATVGVPITVMPQFSIHSPAMLNASPCVSAPCPGTPRLLP